MSYNVALVLLCGLVIGTANQADAGEEKNNSQPPVYEDGLDMFGAVAPIHKDNSCHNETDEAQNG
jgi:hypothetical protein